MYILPCSPLRSFSDFCDIISNFITSQITSCFCCFLNYFFEVSLRGYVVDFLA